MAEGSSATHPALLDEATLLSQCEFKQTRRSGPGGQHRNKTSTAVVLTHQPTGIQAEASERRSQADNRRVATRRLRERLAVEHRFPANHVDSMEPEVIRLRKTYHGKNFRVASSNADYPAVLCLLLDDLQRTSGVLKPVAETWASSTSQIVRFLKSHPPAFEWLNRIRQEQGLDRLR